MAALIQLIARQAQATFTRSFVDDAFPEYFSKLRRLVNQVTCADVGLDDATLRNTTGTWVNGATAAPVTYISLFENVTFTMGIFIVKQGARLPLHDHPEMFGILKVIYGSGNITSYNVKQRKTQSRSILSIRPNSDRDVLLVEKHVHDNVNASSDACCLTPTNGNIHEIVTVDQPVAFLDVLAPPYDMKARICHYYKVLQESQENVVLQEIPPPPEYWCDSEDYKGPLLNSSIVSGHS
ncbi:2-aminoethanethiol dioxygenase-like [Ornithodoros turicata]|uniref:2-aminoethanethiol dioxygenase-like n=1 Tax=Ornithodoros turicata TaxID=34597 RepID=UPI00313A1363